MIFKTAHYDVRELQAEELPALQALFEASPDYFLRANGQPPRPDEARLEYEDQPPPHLSFGTRCFAGVFDGHASLQGLVVWVSDLPAPGVWHIALFFLAGPLRGTGAALELHQAIEAHARASGAEWLRLGVVEGNVAAERFWAKCGYRPVRTRSIPNASGLPTTTRVMVKSLCGGDVDRYLARVPRDAPESTLP